MKHTIICDRPINGIRETYPDEMIKRNKLFNAWSHIANQHNFRQYEAPLLERTELYTRKAGSDILNEMYYFETEKQQVCLRPEVTPSVVRMISKLRINHALKWFSISQCWRFETVTTYRKREHYQLNCDIINGTIIKSELEILNIVVNIFKELGFTSEDIKVKISHRMIMYYFLKTLDLSDDEIKCVMQLLDKIGKMSVEEFTIAAIKLSGMNDNKVNSIIEFTKLSKIDDITVELSGIEEAKGAINDLVQIFNLSKVYDINEWLVIDLSIVRGLDYYTGFVFEAFSTLSEFNRAICGGGRYDNIMVTYGFKKQYSFVGFGMGDVVLLELLAIKKKEFLVAKTDYCLVALDENRFKDVLDAACILRKCGSSVDVGDKIYSNDKNAYKYIDSVDPVKAILFAKDGNSVTVKERSLLNTDPRKTLVIEYEDLVQSWLNETDSFEIKKE